MRLRPISDYVLVALGAPGTPPPTIAGALFATVSECGPGVEYVAGGDHVLLSDAAGYAVDSPRPTRLVRERDLIAVVEP